MTEEKLKAGELAPTFTIETLSGEVSSTALLEDAQKGLVVYFYPKAGTPGCTTEACDFRDNLNSLKSAGYTVIGISTDSLAALKRFQDKQHLNFLLGSDPDHLVADQFHAWGKKIAFGKINIGMIRSTFVINKDGRLALAQYNVRAKGHVARLRDQLGL